jgi:hypothetical protein
VISAGQPHIDVKVPEYHIDDAGLALMNAARCALSASISIAMPFFSM